MNKKQSGYIKPGDRVYFISIDELKYEKVLTIVTSETEEKRTKKYHLENNLVIEETRIFKTWEEFIKDLEKQKEIVTLYKKEVMYKENKGVK